MPLILPPKWHEITSDPSWKTLTPEQQDADRFRWLMSVRNAGKGGAFKDFKDSDVQELSKDIGYTGKKAFSNYDATPPETPQEIPPSVQFPTKKFVEPSLEPYSIVPEPKPVKEKIEVPREPGTSLLEGLSKIKKAAIEPDMPEPGFMAPTLKRPEVPEAILPKKQDDKLFESIMPEMIRETDRETIKGELEGRDIKEVLGDVKDTWDIATKNKNENQWIFNQLASGNMDKAVDFIRKENKPWRKALKPNLEDIQLQSTIKNVVANLPAMVESHYIAGHAGVINPGAAIPTVMGYYAMQSAAESFREQINDGVDPEIARVSAMASGAMEGAAEGMFDIALKAIPGAGKIAKAKTKTGIRQAIKAPVKKFMNKVVSKIPVNMQGTVKAGTEFVKNVLGEDFEESVQNLIRNVSSNVSKVFHNELKGKKFNDEDFKKVKDIITDSVYTGISATDEVLVLVGAGGAARIGLEKIGAASKSLTSNDVAPKKPDNVFDPGEKPLIPEEDIAHRILRESKEAIELESERAGKHESPQPPTAPAPVSTKAQLGKEYQKLTGEKPKASWRKVDLQAELDRVKAEPAKQEPKFSESIEEEISNNAGFPIKNNKKVWLTKDTKGRDYKKAKHAIVYQIIDNNTVLLKRTVDRKVVYQQVDISRISEPANLTSARKRNEELSALNKENRKKTISDDREFNKLLYESPYFVDMDSISQIESQGTEKQRQIKKAQYLRILREEIKQELNVPDSVDMSSPIERAKLLPRLKELVSTKEAGEKITRIKTSKPEQVIDYDIGEGDLVYRNGEWYLAEKRQDEGVETLLVDGEEIEMRGADYIDAQGIVSKGQPGYGAAMQEYKEQEKKVKEKPVAEEKPVDMEELNRQMKQKQLEQLAKSIEDTKQIPEWARNTAENIRKTAQGLSIEELEKNEKKIRTVLDGVNKQLKKDIGEKIATQQTFFPEEEKQSDLFSQPQKQTIIDRIKRTAEDLARLTDAQLKNELNTVPLTHVKTLGAGQQEFSGTYLSTEKGNRYAEKGTDVLNVEADIKNPKIFRDAFQYSSYRENFLPEGVDNIDNATDKQVLDAAQKATDSLIEKGYDSVYLPESETNEGILVVFDKATPENVEETEDTKTITTLAQSIPLKSSMGELGSVADIQRGVDSDRMPQNLALDLPEMVMLTQKLNLNRVPKIVKSLRNRGWLGVFRLKKNTIELVSSIFKGPQIGEVVLKKSGLGEKIEQFKAKLSEKTGLELDDIMIDYEVIRGKNEVVIKAYKRDPRFAGRIIAHEIGHFIDSLPEHLISRGNILGRIASLYRYTRTLLSNIPSDPDRIISSGERRQIKRRAEIVAREQTKDKAERRKIASDLYKKYLTAEIKARGLYTREEIMQELKDLSQWWLPFDERNIPYTKYRYSPVELYADAFSVLLNNPEALRTRAPKFYKAFFDYLGKKQNVKNVYNQIQEDMRSGQSLIKIANDTRKAMSEGDDIFYEGIEDKSYSIPETYRAFKQAFVDRDEMLKRLLKPLLKNNLIDPRFNPEEAKNRAIYAGSLHEAHVMAIERNVAKLLQKANMLWSDLGEYMFHKRIIKERTPKGLANPRGFTAETSQQVLDRRKEQFGEKSFSVIEKAQNAFWEARQKVIELIEETELLDDKDLQNVKDNEFYATFAVIKHLEKKGGKAISSGIIRQLGTLEDVMNPATATLAKNIALITMSLNNHAKRLTVEQLAPHYPNLFEKVTKRDEAGNFIEPRGKKYENMKLLEYMHKGKRYGWMIPRAMVESFDIDNSMADEVLLHGLRTLTAPMRMIFTQLSPGFQVANVLMRDPGRSLKNLPGARIHKLLPAYAKAFTSIAKEVVGITDADIQEMLWHGMMPAKGMARGMRIHKAHAIRNVEAIHLNKRLQRKLVNMLYSIGDTGERLGKVASFKYMKSYSRDMSPYVMAKYVREFGASPAFLLGGTRTPWSNNIAMFSNAMIQSVTSNWEAFKMHPVDYAVKTFMYSAAPKLLMFALSSGVAISLVRKAMKAFGKDDEEMKKTLDWLQNMKIMYASVSDYDKTNYIIIPMGVNESNKTVYLRIPLDEQIRLEGGLLWKALHKDKTGYVGTVVDYMADQLPGVNPVFNVLMDTLEYASGKNPRDDWRNRDIMPKKLDEARDMRSHIYFAKKMAEKLGVGIYYKFKGASRDEAIGEIENIFGSKEFSELLKKTIEVSENPVAAPLIGRFVKFSDYGLTEEYEEAAKKVKQEHARKQLDVEEVLIKTIDGEKITHEEYELLRDKDLKPYIERKWKDIKTRSKGSPLVNALEGKTNNEKIAIIKRHLEIFKKE